MSKLPIILGLALTVVATFAIVTIADQPARSSNAPSILPPAVALQTKLEPGVYAASPYPMTVAVPELIDTNMVIVVSNDSTFKMPCMKPEMQLEPH